LLNVSGQVLLLGLGDVCLSTAASSSTAAPTVSSTVLVGSLKQVTMSEAGLVKAFIATEKARATSPSFDEPLDERLALLSRHVLQHTHTHTHTHTNTYIYA
jgi:hypothetical protein